MAKTILTKILHTRQEFLKSHTYRPTKLHVSKYFLNELNIFFAMQHKKKRISEENRVMSPHLLPAFVELPLVYYGDNVLGMTLKEPLPDSADQLVLR